MIHGAVHVNKVEVKDKDSSKIRDAEAAGSKPVASIKKKTDAVRYPFFFSNQSTTSPIRGRFSD